MSATNGKIPPLLWSPSPERVRRANITRYLDWLRTERGAEFSCYDELWRWSVQDLAAFWASIWDFFGVRAHAPYQRVLGRAAMPGSEWFPGARLNYAEHLLARVDDAPALLFAREDGVERTVSFAELRRQVAAVAAALREIGVGAGDRVAALLPNAPEAIVAMLATTSLGAVWSSCSPDFGPRAIADRFTQIEPVALVTVDGYRYGGKAFPIADTVTELRHQLPTLKATLLVPYLDPAATLPGARRWPDVLATPGELRFESVEFDHPLWILYSSGTTGLPKPIVHGHGGILLEHLKVLSLHTDIAARDRFFWFTTTGWMMWNFLVTGLALGATLVLYDGSPTFPDPSALWRLADRLSITYFGTSAPFIQAGMKAGLHPGRDHDLAALAGTGSTGSPLPPEGFAWVYDEVKRDLLLGSISGGTDICTAIVGAVPLLPVHAGEIPCRMLGCAVAAYDEQGRPVLGEVGELVITAPMPSMPVRFWNDPDGSRLREAYFETYPGVWRHGDWIKITDRGTCVIYGRSDSTLNRGGVRMGTSEFYRVVEDLPEVADSLVVDTSGASGEGELLLFVVLTEGASLEEVSARLRDRIRRELSPRHVPNRIVAVGDVPKTLNGKKCEVPVKRILAGVPVERAISAGALRSATALEPFLALRGAPSGQARSREVPSGEARSGQARSGEPAPTRDG